MLVRLVTAVSLLVAVGRSAEAAVPCERLASQSLQGGTVLSARVEPAGRFVPPAPPAGAAQPIDNLPAFCRVTASLKPTGDSDIRIEVWLPATNWNGKLQSVGNSAWGDAIPYAALGTALTSGYAAAATDTGHVGNNGKFAKGHPEQLIDYGYRAVHEMTVVAKSLIDAP